MDSIGDFLTCIRNGISAGKQKVDIPSSNIRKNIAGKLKQYGYIRGYSFVEDGKQGTMRVYLKYDEKQVSAIKSIRRLSRPSLRCYVKAKDIQDVRSGYGLTILSTHQGILSGREARKKKVGGELLCEVW